MTIGMSSSTAAGFLSAILQAQSFVVDAVWVKLHTGDPGSDGTGNAATETTRMDASAAFDDAPADNDTSTGQTISNTDEIGPISSVSTTETYSHVSFWDDDTAGTFLGSGSLTTTKSVTAGDSFSIPVGHLTVSVPNAS